MKKAQILSAIALAFALGVVAPVASIANSSSASAFSIEDKTATGKEVANAIAAMENNSTYKQAAALIKAYNDYTADTAHKKYADFDVTNAGKIVNAMKTAEGSSATDYKIAGVAPSADAGDNTLAETEAVITAVEGNAAYKAYSALNAALEGEDKQTLVNAIKEYYKVNETAAADQIDFSDNTGIAKDFASIKAAITTTDGPYELDDLDKFDTVAATIKTTNENISLYNAGYALLNTPLTVAGVLSATGKGALQSADKNDLDAIAAIIASTSGSTTTYADNNFSFSLTNWADRKSVV